MDPVHTLLPRVEGVRTQEQGVPPHSPGVPKEGVVLRVGEGVGEEGLQNHLHCLQSAAPPPWVVGEVEVGAGRSVLWGAVGRTGILQEGSLSAADHSLVEVAGALLADHLWLL